MKKKIGMILFMIPLFASLLGCQKSSTSESTSSTSSKAVQETVTDSENEVGYQLDLPESGEEVAIFTTSMGEMKMRFFEKAAPKAVENFKTHSRNGYYDGLIFHRVINNFMIQTGDPKGNGTGGQSIWGKSFEDEFSDKLFNIRGSVAMANSGKDTNGSQFFINQAPKDKMLDWNIMEKRLASYIDFTKVTDSIKNLYSDNGGNINLDGYLSKKNTGHTVFAQVYEGLDVVDQIAAVAVNNSDKPLEDVKIEKIEIVTV